MENSWALLLGGAGIGTILTSIVQHFLAQQARKNDLRFSELKEAYTGLLAAVGKLNESDSRENQVGFGMWAARVQLVGSPAVTACIEEMRKTDPHTASRGKAIDNMLREMRRDLGIAL